jgi:hypothetical protein
VGKEERFFPVCSRIRGAAIRHDKIATHTQPVRHFLLLTGFHFPSSLLSFSLSLFTRWEEEEEIRKKALFLFTRLSFFIYIPYAYSCLSIWERGRQWQQHSVKG